MSEHPLKGESPPHGPSVRSCGRGALAAIVVRTVVSLETGLLAVSFSFDAATRVKAKLPATPSGLLTAEGGDILMQEAKDAKAAGLDSINPLYPVLTSKFETVEELHSTGLEVIPWTVDDKAAMTKLFEARVDALITDDVPAAVAARTAARQPSSGGNCLGLENPKKDTGGCSMSGSQSAAWLFLPLIVVALRRARAD